MLNLSDKELDHFTKEAAQEYDPGDVLGERSWEKLSIRLDRDLGKVHLNPLRHIRRFPFYYAPAMLVLLGVSYYLIRRTGSPPGRVVKAQAAVVQKSSSTQNPVYTEKSTLDSSAATPTLPAQKAGGNPVGGSEAAAGSANANAANPNAASNASPTASTAAINSAATSTSATTSAKPTAANSTNSTNAAASSASARARRNSNHHPRNGRKNNTADRGDNALAITAPANAGHAASGKDITSSANGTTGVAANTAGAANRSNNTHAAPQQRELGKTTLLGLRPTKKAPYISDSGLRAFTLKSTAPQLIRKSGMHVNRSLEFGLSFAPDFASVNSLAGDRPGSSIGLTVDYQFANHWYLGSGLLLDRKIFSARIQDFHAPQQFYADNGMNGADVYLVKGSFEMLEIPLNLRYDFSVTGNTLFFISSGLSSYLMTSQHNNYYYKLTWNPRDNGCTPLTSPDQSYIFSAVNLSMGVETGLSNSLSMMIAPYIKIPTRGIGVGQVQMNTVGINFALKFAPVISRRRY